MEANVRVRLRIELEKKIAKAAIKGLLEDGFKISVYDGETTTLENSTKSSKILKAMFTTDEDILYVYHPDGTAGWVHFIYGNEGYDVIHDNTVNIEKSLRYAEKIIEKY